MSYTVKVHLFPFVTYLSVLQVRLVHLINDFYASSTLDACDVAIVQLTVKVRRHARLNRSV